MPFGQVSLDGGTGVVVPLNVCTPGAVQLPFPSASTNIGLVTASATVPRSAVDLLVKESPSVKSFGTTGHNGLETPSTPRAIAITQKSVLGCGSAATDICASKRW